MLTQHAASAEVKCDVCGRTETIPASSHAEAWQVLKSRAWVVRRKAFPIIHICPECPAEGASK